MKKLIIFALLLINVNILCQGFEHSDQFLSVVKLPPQSATRDKITKMLGKPDRVEETKKGTRWFYSHDSTDLVVHWRKSNDVAEKFLFNYHSAKRNTYDCKIEQKLKEGALDMYQAVLLLGTPKDMIIKEATQVIRYSFQGNILRLFFRNRTLVDYALVENKQE